jgi:pilus assembly protein CpaB
MRRPVIFAILAGLASVLAAIIVFSALKRREAEVQRAMANTADVVVAAHELALGTRIGEGSVKIARWSRDSVPPGAFSDPQAVANAFVKDSFVTGEPIVASKLFMGEKTASVMPLLIPPGMRAMSVPVDEVSDIAGFVLPRTRVDVLVAVASPSADVPAFSKIVLQNVEVLAVAQEIERTKDTPQLVKVVTLLVSPEQAERLALASREGILRLAMRNYNDQKYVATAGVEVHDLFHGGPAIPVVPSQPLAPQARPLRAAGPAPVSVEIFRDGKTAQSVSFINAGLIRQQRREHREGAAGGPAATMPGASASPAESADPRSPEHSAASGPLPAIAVAPRAEAPAAASAATPYQPAPKTLCIP